MPEMHGAIFGDVQDGWYGETGISKTPSCWRFACEHHELCEWSMHGTWCPELFGDVQDDIENQTLLLAWSLL